MCALHHKGYEQFKLHTQSKVTHVQDTDMEGSHGIIDANVRLQTISEATTYLAAGPVNDKNKPS